VGGPSRKAYGTSEHQEIHGEREVSLGARARNESLARGFRLPWSSERHMEPCEWIRSPGELTAKRGIKRG
jgi:hypothetical protein